MENNNQSEVPSFDDFDDLVFKSIFNQIHEDVKKLLQECKDNKTPLKIYSLEKESIIDNGVFFTGITGPTFVDLTILSISSSKGIANELKRIDSVYEERVKEAPEGNKEYLEKLEDLKANSEDIKEYYKNLEVLEDFDEDKLTEDKVVEITKIWLGKNLPEFSDIEVVYDFEKEEEIKKSQEEQNRLFQEKILKGHMIFDGIKSDNGKVKYLRIEEKVRENLNNRGAKLEMKVKEKSSFVEIECLNLGMNLYMRKTNDYKLEVQNWLDNYYPSIYVPGVEIV